MVKGLLWNKVIFVFVVLLISVFVFWVVILLLMFGGVYLCFEGFEKIVYKYLFYDDEYVDEVVLVVNVDVVVLEK